MALLCISFPFPLGLLFLTIRYFYKFTRGTGFAVLIPRSAKDLWKNSGGIPSNWDGCSRYTKWRANPGSCWEDWWNAGNPDGENPTGGISWNGRNGNSRNRRTRISRSSSGKKNDADDLRIASFKSSTGQPEQIPILSGGASGGSPEAVPPSHACRSG